LKMKVEDPEQKMALLVKEGLEVRRDGDMLFVDIAEASRIREVLDRMKPTDFDVVEPTLENAFLKLSV